MATTPIDSGDGSQAAAAGSFRPSGFAPAPIPTTTTNVAAPLDVRAGPSGASVLAQQLEQSLQSLRYPISRAEMAQGAETGKQNFEQGSADALANKVSDDVMEKDQNYRAGVMRVRAQGSMIQAADAWQQWVANPKNGVAGMSPTQFAMAHDQFMRGQLGGLETDPTAAETLLPLVQHSANESLGRFLQYKHQQNFSDGLTTSVQLAQSQLQHGGTLFDYEKQLGTLTALAVGAGGSRSDAKTALDTGLIQAAVANHNGALMDLIKPAPGQSALAPATQLKIDEAKDSITRYNNEQTQQGVQQRQFGILSAWDDSLAKKIPISESAIDEAVKNKDISQDSGLSYLNRSNDLREKLTTQAAAFHVLTSTPGNWYSQLGKQIPGAKPGVTFTKDKFQYAADQSIASLPPQQQVQRAFQLTQSTNLTYTPLKATLENEPLNTPTGIKDVIGQYGAMAARDTSVASQYFSDPKRLAEVKKLYSMKQQGMSDDDIATWVQKHTGSMEQSGAAATIKGASMQQAITKWKLDADDGSTVSLNDLANAGAVEGRVRSTFQRIMQSPLYSSGDAGQALQLAQQQVRDSSYVLNVGPGHSLMIPRATSDPPADLSQHALQWFYTNRIPEIAKSNGHTGDTDGITLVPNPSQPGSFDLVNRFYEPVGHASYSLNDIAAKYSEYIRSTQGEKYSATERLQHAEKVASPSTETHKII
jgi:hypothetical protein